MNASLSPKKADGVTDASPFDPNDWCEVVYRVVVDSEDVFRWNTPGLSKAWASYSFTDFVNLEAGKHDIKIYVMIPSTSKGVPMRHYGGTGKMPGTLIRVRDYGVTNDER